MFGYIDPAAGATIMQLIVAGTVGVGAVVKLKWHTIKSFFDRSGGMANRSSNGITEIRERTIHPADSQD